MKYKGQEKVKVITGKYKNLHGYVRIVYPSEELRIVLDNGLKITINKNEVEFIHENYFISETTKILKSKPTTHD